MNGYVTREVAYAFEGGIETFEVTGASTSSRTSRASKKPALERTSDDMPSWVVNAMETGLVTQE